MERALDMPVVFTAHTVDGAEPVELRLKDLRREPGAGLQALVETDAATAARLAGRGFFHDTSENRLEEVEGGFTADLPVKIELALRPERADALPGAEHDVRAWLEQLPAGDALLREDSWNALQVWQEHALDASIGGGVMKVGYRTVFSAPRNEIDALKRRGPVTRTVVEALIENGLPVHFEGEAFVLGLGVGDREYRCLLRPDDVSTGLSLTVFADGVAQDAIDEVNGELSAGAFEPAEHGVQYVLELQIDEALVSESWVIETLRAGVSIVHHYAPRLLTT